MMIDIQHNFSDSIIDFLTQQYPDPKYGLTASKCGLIFLVKNKNRPSYSERRFCHFGSPNRTKLEPLSRRFEVVGYDELLIYRYGGAIIYIR
jgi:hypothetical protein